MTKISGSILNVIVYVWKRGRGSIKFGSVVADVFVDIDFRGRHGNCASIVRVCFNKSTGILVLIIEQPLFLKSWVVHHEGVQITVIHLTTWRSEGHRTPDYPKRQPRRKKSTTKSGQFLSDGEVCNPHVAIPCCKWITHADKRTRAHRIRLSVWSLKNLRTTHHVVNENEHCRYFRETHLDFIAKCTDRTNWKCTRKT